MIVFVRKLRRDLTRLPIDYITIILKLPCTLRSPLRIDHYFPVLKPLDPVLNATRLFVASDRLQTAIVKIDDRLRLSTITDDQLSFLIDFRSEKNRSGDLPRFVIALLDDPIRNLFVTATPFVYFINEIDRVRLPIVSQPDESKRI